MIDLSATAGNLVQSEEHFESIDPILDLSERSMLAVAAEHRLRNIRFDRWRWDQPEVLMSWLPSRHSTNVGKNIRVLVKVEQAHAFRIQLESNAWYDDREDPGVFVRYWAHFPAGEIPVTGPDEAAQKEEGWIREYVERAYEYVSDSKEVTLDQSVIIRSNGTAKRTDGSVVLSPAISG